MCFNLIPTFSQELDVSMSTLEAMIIFAKTQILINYIRDQEESSLFEIIGSFMVRQYREITYTATHKIGTIIIG
jgi:hypothetical protein